MKQLYLLIAIWALVTFPSHSIANPDTGDQQSTALALSGGISLGSYEAGLNWAIVKHYRNRSLDRAGPYQHFLAPFQVHLRAISTHCSLLSVCASLLEKRPHFPLAVKRTFSVIPGLKLVLKTSCLIPICSTVTKMMTL